MILQGCPDLPAGEADADFSVDIFVPEKVYHGTTLLGDNHNLTSPRIIEVNMAGEIVWEYNIPANLTQFTNPGFDTEPLPNGNILFVLPRIGVYEIDRQGKTVWSYLTPKISHDADRLPNGNTIFVYGADDTKSDYQVTEIDPSGKVVWQWQAAKYFDKAPYASIYNQGWTHTNSVTRMANGNTLISPRNFDLMVEVDANGDVVRTIGEGIFFSNHDPEVQPNGNILAVSQWKDQPHKAIEINPDTGEVVWEFGVPARQNWPVRDANRLPNGNTLITGSSAIIEVTPAGEVVWRFRLGAGIIPPGQGSMLGFYKATRLCPIAADDAE